MTQKIAYEILKELGGTAKMVDIISRCVEKYPNDSWHKYGRLSTRLGQLRKSGYVKLENGKWTIIEEWNN